MQEKQRKIEMKGYSSPTLEKQKIFVMGKTGFTKDALNNIYRDFLSYINKRLMRIYILQEILLKVDILAQ